MVSQSTSIFVCAVGVVIFLFLSFFFFFGFSGFFWIGDHVHSFLQNLRSAGRTRNERALLEPSSERLLSTSSSHRKTDKLFAKSKSAENKISRKRKYHAAKANTRSTMTITSPEAIEDDVAV